MTLSRLWRSRSPTAGLLDNVSKTHSQNWTAGDPAIRERNNFRLCTAVRNCGLLLAHPRNGNKRVWSWNAQKTSWRWFLNLASHLQMKHLGINQVCNLLSDFPRHTIAYSFGASVDVIDLAIFCHNLCSILSLIVTSGSFGHFDSSEMPRSFERVSKKFAAATWDAEAPCSVNTALYSFFVFGVVLPEHISPLVNLELFCKFGVLQSH